MLRRIGHGEALHCRIRREFACRLPHRAVIRRVVEMKPFQAAAEKSEPSHNIDRPPGAHDDDIKSSRVVFCLPTGPLLCNQPPWLCCVLRGFAVFLARRPGVWGRFATPGWPWRYDQNNYKQTSQPSRRRGARGRGSDSQTEWREDLRSAPSFHRSTTPVTGGARSVGRRRGWETKTSRRSQVLENRRWRCRPPNLDRLKRSSFRQGLWGRNVAAFPSIEVE